MQINPRLDQGNLRTQNPGITALALVGEQPVPALYQTSRHSLCTHQLKLEVFRYVLSRIRIIKFSMSMNIAAHANAMH